LRDTRPHIIGGHGDYVWLMGKFANAPLRDLETWAVPGGSAVAALYTFRQPGVLRLRQSQPHPRPSNSAATAHFPRRGQVERRLDDPGAPARPNRLSAPHAVAAEAPNGS